MHTQHPSRGRLAALSTSALLALAMVASAQAQTHAQGPGKAAPHKARAGAAPATAGSAIVPAAMDTSVDACEDFYLRACGGYIASSKVDGSHPERQMANEQFEASLERSFATLFARDDPANPELARVKTFYGACMAGGANDGAVVKSWLARIDGADNPAQLQALMLELAAIGVDPFFSYSAQPDRKDWQRYRGEIHNSYIWANEQAVRRAFLDAGMPEADAGRDAATVAAIAAALRKERGDRYDSATAENPRPAGELAQLAPSVDWTSYLALVGAHPQQTVNVTAPGYLRAVEKELARPPAELRAWLRWSFLFSLRGELPAPYNAAFADLNPALRVDLGNPAGRCRDATVRAMGVEFSRQYATRVLGLEAREAAQRIAQDIKTGIVAAVARADWLSPEARRATADKLAETDLKIGFPDRWPEVGDYPLAKDAFLANVLAARRYEQQRTWSTVGREHARGNWDMIVSPWVGDGMAAARLTVSNGFPDALSNSLIMTAAFLNAPRFDAKAAPELNYATFGTVFAHEFVHVAELHMFGRDGRDQELWSEADIKAEEKQGQCLVEQANSYAPLPGVKMQGERQYPENVADLGGMRLAFEALEARLGTKALYKKDASGLSPAQRFFYRYAQNRCTAQTEDFLRKSVETDGHAPAAFRINAPLTNLPGFARAFQCKPNAKMVKPAAQQCRVW